MKLAEGRDSALALFEQQGFGYAAANAAQIVTFAAGNLAKLLPPGSSLCETYAPLRGMERKIAGLPQEKAGSKITISTVSIVKDARVNEKTSLIIAWDHEAQSYAICSYPAQDEAERKITATLRLKRISQEIMRAGGHRVDDPGGGEGDKSLPTARIADCLTPREREVVSLLAAGRTNKGVARILGLSAKTVEAHRARALKRLNVKTTADLIRLAIEGGLVHSDR
jgi:DNA-binding CsgD family transcriptional regulator